MKRFVMVIALACALSSGALAGDIPTSDFVAPLPGGTQKTSAIAPGDIPSGNATSLGTGVKLSLIQAMIGLMAM